MPLRRSFVAVEEVEDIKMLALNWVLFVKSKFSEDERGKFSSVMGGLYAIPDKFGQVFCYKLRLKYNAPARGCYLLRSIPHGEIT